MAKDVERKLDIVLGVRNLLKEGFASARDDIKNFRSTFGDAGLGGLLKLGGAAVMIQRGVAGIARAMEDARYSGDGLVNTFTDLSVTLGDYAVKNAPVVSWFTKMYEAGARFRDRSLYAVADQLNAIGAAGARLSGVLNSADQSVAGLRREIALTNAADEYERGILQATYATEDHTRALRRMASEVRAAQDAMRKSGGLVPAGEVAALREMEGLIGELEMAKLASIERIKQAAIVAEQERAEQEAARERERHEQQVRRITQMRDTLREDIAISIATLAGKTLEAELLAIRSRFRQRMEAETDEYNRRLLSELQALEEQAARARENERLERERDKLAGEAARKNRIGGASVADTSVALLGRSFLDIAGQSRSENAILDMSRAGLVVNRDMLKEIRGLRQDVKRGANARQEDNALVLQ